MTGQELYEELRSMSKDERQGPVLFRDEDGNSTEIETVVSDAGDIVLTPDIPEYRLHGRG